MWRDRKRECKVEIQFLWGWARAHVQQRRCRRDLVVPTTESVLIRWTGLAPWDFEFPFPGSLTSTFLVGRAHLSSATERNGGGRAPMRQSAAAVDLLVPATTRSRHFTFRSIVSFHVSYFYSVHAFHVSCYCFMHTFSGGRAPTAAVAIWLCLPERKTLLIDNPMVRISLEGVGCRV